MIVKKICVGANYFQELFFNVSSIERTITLVPEASKETTKEINILRIRYNDGRDADEVIISIENMDGTIHYCNYFFILDEKNLLENRYASKDCWINYLDIIGNRDKKCK